jgi:hypothetical protein
MHGLRIHFSADDPSKLFIFDGAFYGGFKGYRFFLFTSQEEVPLLLSGVSSTEAVQLCAERIAQCERSDLPTPDYSQAIGCWLTSFNQLKRKLAGPSPNLIVIARARDCTRVNKFLLNCMFSAASRYFPGALRSANSTLAARVVGA